MTRTPAGTWRNIPETLTLFETLVREAFAVAAAQGIDLGEKTFADISKQLWNVADDFITSMQRDLASGKKSELRQQIGAIVRFGKAAGIPVPVSDAVYSALLPSDVT